MTGRCVLFEDAAGEEMWWTESIDNDLHTYDRSVSRTIFFSNPELFTDAMQSASGTLVTLDCSPAAHAEFSRISAVMSSVMGWRTEKQKEPMLQASKRKRYSKSGFPEGIFV